MKQKIVTKTIFTFILWCIFLGVMFFVKYPSSITQASLFQLVVFFVPLYLALTFTIYIVVNKLIICMVIALGIILALLLKALDSLNIVTSLLIIGSVWFLVNYAKDMFDKPIPKNPLKKFEI